MAKRSLSQKRTHYTPRSAGSAASKFGQMIGTAFERVVIELIADYLAEKYPDYEIAQATDRKFVGLDMFGGKARKVDNTIIPVNSDDPIALLETKWLKDGRHHNDKGAWILQLREICKQYPSIRGTGAILIGFWTNDVVVFLMSEGQVKAVRIATDEQVYASLQPYLDTYLDSHDQEPLTLDAKQIRDKYERAWDLANCIQWMDEQEELLPLAEQWLLFKHSEAPQPGEQKIQKMLDEFGSFGLRGANRRSAPYLLVLQRFDQHIGALHTRIGCYPAKSQRAMNSYNNLTHQKLNNGLS